MTLRKLPAYLTIIGIALLFSLAPASASTTGAVGGASVEKGKLSADFRVGYSDAEKTSSQDQRLRFRTHLDYGLTDFYAFRVIFATDKRKGNDMEAESIGIENRFYILRADEYGFDFGARLKYTVKDGDKKPDSAGLGLYQQIPLDNWEIRFNETFSHEVGEDSTGGVSLEIRSQTMYKLENKISVGLESYNDFGNLNEQSGYSAQNHTIGPVIKGKLFNDIGYETGYRAGISNSAPDHSFKMFLSKSF